MPEDYYSCSASVNACARCARWQQSLELAVALSDQKLPPNGIMWGTIIKAMPDKVGSLGSLVEHHDGACAVQMFLPFSQRRTKMR